MQKVRNFYIFFCGIGYLDATDTPARIPSKTIRIIIMIVILFHSIFYVINDIFKIIAQTIHKQDVATWACYDEVMTPVRIDIGNQMFDS